jgi:creatinine amidohydrolase/Fe(II)-dependent formamide hydrolase-like protein
MRKAALFVGLATFMLTTIVMAQQAGQQQQQAGQQQQQQTQGQRGGGRQNDPNSRGGGQCANNKWNCIDTPNPLPKVDTVWLEEMTWMDVRDAMAAGKKTVIISTGGIEPNGPFLALGKHNYVLRANCEAIARKLGDALCAPIDPFVPEGPPTGSPTGHMNTMGTISLREETFQALLTDIVTSLKSGGFKNIMLIGDSGGNTKGMAAVAQKLNAEWGADPVVAHIGAHYQYSTVGALLNELGVTKPGMADDGLHDDPGITMNMMMTDPNSVRWEARVKAGLATINGVSIADKAKALEIGKKIVEMRATNTAAAIKAAIASKGKTGG